MTKAKVVVGLEATALDVANLVDEVRSAAAGGLVVFEGTTRSPNRGIDVIALDYEAWEERVPAQLEAIATEVAAAHGLLGAVGVQRVGRVAVGDAAVVVVAAAAHRDAAFAGARDLIDRIKAEAWIWKREIRPDGSVWVEGCA